MDPGLDNFYLLSLLFCIVRLDYYLLIRKMHFYVLKIFFVLSVFVYLKLFFLVFVVLCECIQLFVYAALLQDRIFDYLFHSCVLRLFVYFLGFSMI